MEFSQSMIDSMVEHTGPKEIRFQEISKLSLSKLIVSEFKLLRPQFWLKKSKNFSFFCPLCCSHVCQTRHAMVASSITQQEHIESRNIIGLKVISNNPLERICQQNVLSSLQSFSGKSFHQPEYVLEAYHARIFLMFISLMGAFLISIMSLQQQETY